MSGPPTDGTTTRHPRIAEIAAMESEAKLVGGTIRKEEARAVLDELDALLRERDEARLERDVTSAWGRRQADLCTEVCTAADEAVAQRDEARQALRIVRDWIRDGIGSEAEAAEATDAVLGSLTEGEQ